MHSMSSRASSWTLMGDFFVQECCVHGTDLESHGPTSILCDDPLPIESTTYLPSDGVEAAVEGPGVVMLHLGGGGQQLQRARPAQLAQ